MTKYYLNHKIIGNMSGYIVIAPDKHQEFFDTYEECINYILRK